MNKNLIAIGIAIILLSLGLSGCEQINEITKQKTKLSDGTEVTGDINEMKIMNYTLTKYAKMTWNQQHVTFYEKDGRLEQQYVINSGQRDKLVPWGLNVTGIDTNETKRKEIMLTYIESEYERWNEYTYVYDAPFTLHLEEGTQHWEDWDKFGLLRTSRISEVKLEEKPIWGIEGTIKNIGKEYQEKSKVIVNFYNIDGAWLDSETYYEDNTPSGYSWDFNLFYSDEFSNDVHHISFELDVIDLMV
ncbi:MAG: hypothetical protein ACFFKA_04445 [Candidatus Thorarchaeota archaeon]